MMKSDVLDQFETIKACDAYEIDGKIVRDFPYSIDREIKPIYTEVKGWNTSLTDLTDESQLPLEFVNYIKFLEDRLGVPITIVSIGPDRKQTIFRNKTQLS